MTLDQLTQAASSIGVLGLLIASLYGLYKQWWVPGWVFRNVEKDRDFWRDLALRGLDITERVIKPGA